jgi:hypothetical protein
MAGLDPAIHVRKLRDMKGHALIDRRAILSSLILPLGVAGCSWASATARLKLTLKANIRGAVHEGSTVFQSTLRKTSFGGVIATDSRKAYNLMHTGLAILAVIAAWVVYSRHFS